MKLTVQFKRLMGMGRDDRCRCIREQFPLLFNQTLDESEAATLRRHLKECPACRAAFTKERILFDTASKLAENEGLEDRP